MCFIHTGSQRAHSCRKHHICITEVIELMMLQDIPNMGKDIQLSLWQAHGLWLFCWPCACVFVLCERMAFSSLFPCALMSMSNPAHLVISSLINVPHLLTLITHHSLFILLVFAVLCQIVVECFPSCSCLRLACSRPASQSNCIFCLFVLIWLLIKSQTLPAIESSPHHYTPTLKCVSLQIITREDVNGKS